MKSCCDHERDHEPAVSSVRLMAPGSTRIRIEQMDCPTEERLIRDALMGVPGVDELQFNLLQRVLSISHEEGALERVIPVIEKLGFTPVVESEATRRAASEQLSTKKPWWPLALSGVAALVAEVVHFTATGPQWL